MGQEEEEGGREGRRREEEEEEQYGEPKMSCDGASVTNKTKINSELTRTNAPQTRPSSVTTRTPGFMGEEA